MNMTNETAVTFTMYEEQELKRQGKPYDPVVITICEWFLNMPRKPVPSFIELSQPEDK